MNNWAKVKEAADKTNNPRIRETSLYSSSSSNVNRHNYGTYMNDGIRRIDYVIVYKKKEVGEENPEHEAQRKFYQNNLKNEGLELEIDQVEQSDETLVFVKVHVPWPTLCQHAEELNIKTPLWIHDKPLIKRDSTYNQSFWQKLCGSGGKDPQEQGEKKMRLYGKNTVINWPFKRKHMERYAIRDPNTYFTEIQRIEIAFEIMQKAASNPKEPKQRGIESLLEDVYETAYPLHDGDIDDLGNQDTITQKSGRLKLKESWATWKHTFHLQPLHEVRNYFGEQIAFYYAFMDTYTRMLLFPSVVGLLTFVIGFISTAYNPEIVNICSPIVHHPTAEGHKSAGSQHTEVNGVTHLENLNAETVLNLSTTTLEAGLHALEETESFDMSSKWMCPVCRPPNCEAWEMNPDGCFYYSWSFRFDNYLSFILSSFTTLWAIVFLKLWKRREASLAVSWDTFEVEEQGVVIRPEYAERAPMERRNPITLESEPFVPLSKKVQWMSISILATIAFLLFACICVIALVVCRIQLYGLLKHVVGAANVDCGKWLVHGLLFIVVTILERLYNKLAVRLTNYECPKTEKQFMNSLLTKIFIFAMLNDIIPIGYAAWLKGKMARTPKDMGPLDELCDGGCMGEVTELVAVLLLVRLVIGNITEIGVPLLKKSCKRVKSGNRDADAGKQLTPGYVKDFHLEEVELDGVYEDYMEMMVQFAFITLFIPALPVAPFVCFLNNVAEIRVDAMKMVRTNRRPLPIRVAGIGIWNKFLDILNKLGVICNAGLLAFTSDNVPRLYYRWIYNPGMGDVGYMKFILSKMPVTFFGADGEDMEKNKIKECFYQDFRKPYSPFDLNPHYWEMMALRLIVFSSYCLFFFILMWFINTFVSDMPEPAITKSKRQHYIVLKTLEAEAAIKEKKQVKDTVVAFKIKQ